VVTTRHGGIPEFVAPGETALLVPEGDADALAEALIRVLADRELASRLGAAGPALAARFDATAMAERVDDLYDALLASRGT
jgi:glycosyltransferase involved in cell wall biosynthesis